VTGHWIGFAAVVGPVILVALFFWFRLKARREMQATIRVALDKGQDLTPELIDHLGSPKKPKDRDFRLGVILVAVGIAVALFSFVIPDEEATGPMLGMAAFPGLIGIAFLILNKFAKQDD